MSSKRKSEEPSEQQQKKQSEEPLQTWDFIRDFGYERSPNLKISQRKFELEVKHNYKDSTDLKTRQDSIDKAYGEAMLPIIANAEPDDLYSIGIKSSKLNGDIYIPPKEVKDFSKQEFLVRVFEISQSNKEFLLDGFLKVNVLIWERISGKGRGRRAMKTMDKIAYSKKSIITVKNNDNSCGYAAIRMGILYYEWKIYEGANKIAWKDLIRRPSAQRRVAQQFCDEYGFDINTSVIDNILRMINEKLKDYQIIVIDGLTQVYVGTDRPKTIYLLLTDDHYDLIKKMSAYLRRDNYCKYCNRGYQHAHKHRCNATCKLCHHTQIHFEDNPTFCSDCGVTLANEHCFKCHKENKSCDKKKCPECLVYYEKNEKHPHKCGEYKCIHCNEWYTQQPHYCYMKPLDLKKLQEEDAKNNIFIPFDIECCLEKDPVTKVMKHIPILLCCNLFCKSCEDSDTCTLHPKSRTFYGLDCLENFIKFLADISETAQKNKCYVTPISHNGGRYDNQFIIRELIRQKVNKIEPTMNGQTLLKIDVGNIRFIDSYLILRSKLADLPKIFGLSDSVKGFFPHYTNTIANQSLVCKLKDIPIEKFAREDLMKGRSVEALDNWYTENKEMEFNLKEKMIEYCESDTDILTKAMKAFRSLFKSIFHIDPFMRCFTLPSIGMEIFRALYLTPETIGITPANGYSNHRKQSVKANAWLDIMEKKFGGKMMREFHFGKYYADGVIELSEPIEDEEGNQFWKIALEFNGCYFHGCPLCNDGKYYNAEKQAEVEKKRAFYKRHGFYPIFQRECEWESIAREDYEERLEYHTKMARESLYIKPREALAGGRTNNFKFGHIAGNGEKIRYLDFTSLYPFVLAHRKFPAKHPILITQFDSLDISKYFGLIKCKVLPPKDLYLPVLPYHENGKLIFPLCRTCAKTQSSNCTCCDEDRALIGEFTSIELQEAVKRGYQILEIYEVLQYEETIDNLFQKFILPLLKIKTEATGYPVGCVDEESQSKFIEKFKEIEGIDLDPMNIIPNPGLRNLAKLMLNSFWGKFAQRPDMEKTIIVRDRTTAWDIYNDEDNQITHAELIDGLLLLSYKNINPNKTFEGNTSPVIGAFVTAYARLHLYEEIEKILKSDPESVLYYDTDSIIFVEKPHTYCPDLGNFMGMMTDEIAVDYGPDAQLKQFFSLGPKTYSLLIETKDGIEEKNKIKGLKQTEKSSKFVNFDVIKQMAEQMADGMEVDSILVPQLQFNIKDFQVYSKHIEKRLGVTSDKRFFIGNNSYPYGYDTSKIFPETSVEEFAQEMADLY